MQANDELAAATGFKEQFDSGRMLEALLMPADIRPAIYTSAPLILMLDATTARVHWEMMAQSDPLTGSPVSPEDDEPPFDSNAFLGTSRGLTRQLRTTFSPPPEPPPPPRRKLNVLIVADPADDAPLPGAQAEGEEVAALFESFNGVYRDLSYNQVEVVRLFGPYEATRTNVLRHLMFTTYDVLHFAGHCVFDTEEPSNSGWIFSRRERLTANELNRVDRIPKFIFSNACESGITPDRSELRNAALAPSFAEAFFQRGRGELHLHRMAGRRPGGAPLRAPALFRAARLDQSRRARADARRDARSPCRDRHPCRRAHLGRLPALWQPVFPLLRRRHHDPEIIPHQAGSIRQRAESEAGPKPTDPLPGAPANRDLSRDQINLIRPLLAFLLHGVFSGIC